MFDKPLIIYISLFNCAPYVPTSANVHAHARTHKTALRAMIKHSAQHGKRYSRSLIRACMLRLFGRASVRRFDRRNRRTRYRRARIDTARTQHRRWRRMRRRCEIGAASAANNRTIDAARHCERTRTQTLTAHLLGSFFSLSL